MLKITKSLTGCLLIRSKGVSENNINNAGGFPCAAMPKKIAERTNKESLLLIKRYVINNTVPIPSKAETITSG